MTKKKYTNKKPYKGRYQVKNIEKYKGNPRRIIYRSLWERRCMMYFDRNENIVQWSSEEISIPYISPIDGRRHNYYPDFLITVKQGDKYRNLLIEVKPAKYLKAPEKNPKRKTKGYLYEVKEWGRNQAKWEAAQRYCEKMGWSFNIWTEKTLNL